MIIDKANEKSQPVQNSNQFVSISLLRHEEADELREEVKVLQKRLSDKTMQFNQAVTTIGVLRDDILGLQATVEEKEEMIDDRDDTIARCVSHPGPIYSK